VLFQAFQPLFDGFSCSGHQGFLQFDSGMVTGIVSSIGSTNISESNKLTADTNS
jgi:hypothetical protein